MAAPGGCLMMCVALVTTVQKTACDLARKELTCMTGSIGVDIAMVVEEVRRLRTDLQQARAHVP